MDRVHMALEIIEAYFHRNQLSEGCYDKEIGGSLCIVG